jgi:beta-N-acetylhexosaminidase
MNIKQAIGCLLSARLSGYTLDKKTEKALREGLIGGVVLFKENARDIKQLAHLIANIKAPSFHEAIISVDQEGGAVQRFDHIITPLPSAMALAAGNDLTLLGEVAEISAKQLKLLGFNCLLAPVLDVLQNPVNSVIATRAYGNSPEHVIKCAGQYLRALKDTGMVAVGKHFPGHGSTMQDSHFELAVNDSPIEEIWSTDLSPFKSCLADLPALLIGHVWLPGVDPQPLPATLSSHVIGRLKKRH